MRPGLLLPANLDDLKKVEAFLNDTVRKLRGVLDVGRLGFGDGKDTDNIFGAWITYTANATPDTEDTIVHNLGLVPIGYLIVSVNNGAVIYKGSTTWTTTSMFLKSTKASTLVTMFVLGPSNQQA